MRHAYRRGSLPAKIVAIYEALPGWAWNASISKPTRSADDWIDLIATHTAASGIRTVHEWERTTDPQSGTDAAIGKWLYQVAAGTRRLTPDQQRRLTAAATIPERRQR